MRAVIAIDRAPAATFCGHTASAIRTVTVNVPGAVGVPPSVPFAAGHLGCARWYGWRPTSDELCNRLVVKSNGAHLVTRPVTCKLGCYSRADSYTVAGRLLLLADLVPRDRQKELRSVGYREAGDGS